MTFSIVARSTDGESWGVAVASKFLAVGAVVPAAVAQVGAIATQADANVAYKGQALAHLDDGATASVALQRLLEEDDKRDERQVGIVDSDGGAASHTGHGCLDWAGGVTGDGYAIQGNILTGPEVVAAMESAWLATAGASLTDRLVAALLAGDGAGGDSRGRQGAALYAVLPGAGYDHCGVLADIRVDDHPDAPQELARLLRMNDLIFGGPEDVLPWTSARGDAASSGDASSPGDAGETGGLAVEVSRRLAELGFHGEVPQALASWAGEANYEMRLSPDGIDTKVLAALRDATSGS
jgi:uncharacterized Ntn-hydrolase superfamily protein